MVTDKRYNALVEAYNHFHPDPLDGNGIDRFYINEFNQEAEKNIETTIDISGPRDNILVIGQVGCGKSTVLNKIARNMAEKYHVIRFSASELLNLSDIQTPDILTAAFLQSVYSLKRPGIKGFPNSSKNLIKLFKKELQIVSSPGFPLVQTIGFKINVESESRKTIRRLFEKNAGAVKSVISATLDEIARLAGKEILMIVDNLDMLTNRSAIRLFSEKDVWKSLSCKTVFAFSLGDYLSTDFASLSDDYALEFINIAPLWDIGGNPYRPAREMFAQLVYKRIDSELVTTAALDQLIMNSGGLIRDLIDSMRTACVMTISNGAGVIDESISDMVIAKKNSVTARLFNFDEYRSAVEQIQQTRLIHEVVDHTVIQLLKRRFVLKYGSEEEKAWFRPHPCLSARLKQGTMNESVND